MRIVYSKRGRSITFVIIPQVNLGALRTSVYTLLLGHLHPERSDILN